MRKPRFKAPPDAPFGYYHCVSRVVDRDFKLGPEEREAFVGMLGRYAEFYGVRVITFCVLSNHFHLVLEIPGRPHRQPDLREIEARFVALGNPHALSHWRKRRASCGNAPERLDALVKSVLARLWDLSAFMQALKQAFTKWFNRRQGRTGTLWEGRFRSVLVEGAGLALLTVAAYVDLNPVRAGLVEDPMDYRWCGYAEAVAGSCEARQGLARAQPDGSGDLEAYRRLLFAAGIETGGTPPGTEARRGFRREDIEAVQRSGGRLTVAQLIYCRVRYFVDGAALGSRLFLEHIFHAHRGSFGTRRRSGPRPLLGVEQVDLYSLRALRRQPIS